MPSLIGTADFNALIDQFSRIYVRIAGDTGQTFGAGVSTGTGVQSAYSDLVDVMGNTSDLVLQSYLSRSVLDLASDIPATEVGFKLLEPCLSMMDRAVRKSAFDAGVDEVYGLESYLAYSNLNPGTYLATMDRRFKPILERWLRAPLGVDHFYGEVSLVTNPGVALMKNARVASVDNISVTPSAAYTDAAGGFGNLVVSGFAGTSGLITVTVFGWDTAAQDVLTGKTMTATVGANGSFVLAPGGADPAPSTMLVRGASAMSVGASITGATIYVEAARPAGRAVVP